MSTTHSLLEAMATERAARGPTVSTLRLLEKVLRQSRNPMSRYEIRRYLENRIGQSLLDEALRYMSDHGMVYDEGPGGKVVWLTDDPETLEWVVRHSKLTKADAIEIGRLVSRGLTKRLRP